MKQNTFFQLSAVAIACAALMACSSSSGGFPSTEASNNNATQLQPQTNNNNQTQPQTNVQTKPQTQVQPQAEDTSKLQQQLDAARARLQKAQADLAKAEKSVAGYKTSLQENSSALDTAKQQLANAQSAVNNAVADVNQHKAEVSRLTAQVNELNNLQKLGNSAEVQQKLDQAKQALAKANASLKEKQSQLTSSQKQADSLSKNVAELENKQRSLSAQVKSKETELNQLKGKVSEADQALTKEKAQLASLKEEAPAVAEATREENYMGDDYKWRSIKVKRDYTHNGDFTQGSVAQNMYQEGGTTYNVLVPDVAAGAGVTEETHAFQDVDFTQYPVDAKRIQTIEQFHQTCGSKEQCYPLVNRKMGDMRFVNQTYSTFFAVSLDKTWGDTYRHRDFLGYGYIYKELPQDNAVWNRPSGQEQVTYHGKTMGRFDRYNSGDNTYDGQGDLTLTADFAKNTVAGKVTNRQGYRDNRNITLIETPIAEVNDKIGFKGNWQYGEHDRNRGRDGTYEGIFVGPNAEEVLGRIAPNPINSGLGSVFGGTSQQQ
ncbi:factor H binding protein domain-containing protein [Avibacterium paragallinarum]|uniref:Transferrin-binding protein-like solute binding protein n=1 Tax=Avibacterium paragallinarum TaxID=728 RepID=A0ABU7QT24_AVIPA|nr:factor H binding protein domain-containing protein [Avibacterium paragallinarum]